MASVAPSRYVTGRLAVRIRNHNTTALLAVVLLIAACSDADVNTLYRNSVTDPSMRIHVATFDATDGEKYNNGNCEQARELFQAQPGVKTRFWCEKGKYRK
jgi:hypothetical protein